MGGSSSSSAQTTQQTDNRVVQGQGAVLAQGGSTVNIQSLDAAIVGRSLDTVDSTIHGALDTVNISNASLVRAVAAANSQAAASVSQASDALASAYSDAKGNNNSGTVMIAIVVMAGLVGLSAFRKN